MAKETYRYEYIYSMPPSFQDVLGTLELLGVGVLA
jgi:hypothetical protein